MADVQKLIEQAEHYAVMARISTDKLGTSEAYAKLAPIYAATSQALSTLALAKKQVGDG